jgi:multidrug efflux pump subunit AcrA (membrane-fusion protein)
MLDNPNPDFLQPVTLDEFLPPVSRWTTLGGLFIVGTGVTAFILAAVIKYNVTVPADATVRPAGELQIVQPATGGTVKEIYVKENEPVRKGKALATIDDSSLQTKKSQLELAIARGREELARISAQLDALNSQIDAETRSIEHSVAAAQQEHSRTRRESEDLLAKTQTELQEAEANLKSAEAGLQKAQIDLQKARGDLEFAKKEREQYNQLVEEGVVPQLELEKKKLAVEQAESALKTQEQVIKEQQQGVKIAEARLQRAKAALNPSQSPVAIATERIEQERARGEATLATLKKEREALGERRIQVQKQIENDQKEHQQIQNDLTKLVIPSPADGTIVKLNLRNPGQEVQRGEVIAQILPTNAPSVIKAQVKTQDRDKVKIGQEVQMRVNSCPYPNYGTLKGIVTAITADAITPQTSSAGAEVPRGIQGAGVLGAYYEVSIQPKSLSLSQGDRQCAITSGMEGRADIISREETVLQFILRKARLLTDL